MKILIKHKLTGKAKITLGLILLLFQFNISYSQEKTFGDAFDFGTEVTGDFIVNFDGGIKTGHTYIGMESLTLEFNTEIAKMWKGGTAFLHGLNMHGNGPSGFLTNDLQVLSNIESGDYTGLYEFWYKQKFGRFFFLIGQHDLNSAFGGTEYGGTFLNSSFGIAPSISLNVPVSIYPVAAPCIYLNYESKYHLEYKLAVYDGNPGNFETNRFNLEWSVSPNQGFLAISEIQYSHYKEDYLLGTYKIGGYYHTGEFTKYNTNLDPVRGNYGIYAIIDHELFASIAETGKGLCVFVQGAIAPSKINMAEYYIGAGLRYHGIFPNRLEDELGLALAHLSMSKEYKAMNPGTLSYETAIEFTYKFQFGPRYSIQPNLQYIINPGAELGVDNCLVGLMRFTLSY